MYKVVIVDDEPIIVEGLRRSIRWESYQCEVVATAANGQEGLKLFEQHRPDIVVSDIRMPHMDGLTMIAAMKSQYPDMEISILTGFQDFEYARQAIRLGVTRFLVKPSKMDELQEALETMVKNLQGKGVSNEQQEDGGESAEGSLEGGNTEANSFIVNNALRYMEEHYQEKLHLQDVAEQVYVSQWHLSKLLNRYKGQSFSDILNHIRIEKAKELLKNPSLRVGDIADKVGFLDVAHFSRVFKKLAGVSANEYRNGLK